MTQQDNIALEATEAKRLAQYRDRWNSFGVNTGLAKLSDKLSLADLRKLDLFQDYDDEFLEKISPDIAIASWKKGAILFEEGAYLDLAFFVLQGSVEIYVSRFKEQATLSRPIFDVSRTMMLKPSEALTAQPETTASRETMLQTQIKKQRPAPDSSVLFLSTLDFDLPAGGGMRLGPGEVVGEIGAMSGWPQSVTARAATDCELLQIRVPALRLMKNESKTFQARLDKVYRERSLAAHLKTTPLLQKCDDAFVEALTQRVELASFRRNQVIAKEGEPAEAFYLVRSGFVKLSQQFGEDQIVVSYLSKGMTLGEIELLLDGVQTWKFTATSVEYSDLVKISRADFRELVKNNPSAEKLLWETAVARIKETGASKKNIGQSAFVQAALETGLVQGNSILVIDLSVCTRCDDCVRACADTHGGRPRFVREGDRYENFLITKACYHCRDPICLVGCPTGAIRRANIGAVVEIEDNLCIGCKACATNCPYDAIVMHDTGVVWPGDALPEYLRGKPRLLASKCDLCSQTNHGPACVGNCPHGCAFRFGSLDEFRQLLEGRA
jgi:CRP-like cAMP-binding protein/Fe-S-cluster-containing dehydrogenase component